METYLFRESIHRLPGKVIHAVPLPKPTVIEGHGARGKIGDICRSCGYKRVMVVTDQTLSGLGFEQAIVRSLQEAGVAYSVFNAINSEPNIPTIEAGRRQALETQAEAIIALGGGSVMDSCKVMAAGVKKKYRSIRSLLLKFLPVTRGTLPIIMVPSTAGTGAELTVGAVVTNAHGAKGATVLIGLKVSHVVLDSELTIHAPQKVTAACAIDALSHCVEGAVSHVAWNEEDMRQSLEGTKLIFENLPVVMKDPENQTARLALCRAAMYGGNAINTQLAGYVHAFAHSIGAMYHLPHGVAISMMLLPVLEVQKDACAERYALLAKHCALCHQDEPTDKAAEAFLQAVRALMTTCGMDSIPSPVKKEDIERLVPLVAADSINYSAPKTLSNKEIRNILMEIAN